MTIYLPSLLDKFKDFVNGIKANWQEYEAHVDNTTDAHGIDEHIAATAEDDVHGLAGKIIEDFGSNDNGSYVKWSNGLQICWIPSITLTYTNTGRLEARWDYPAEFKSGSIPTCTANPSQMPSVYEARTAGTVANCEESYCRVIAIAPTGTFKESDTWDFQAVAIGWWK